MEMLTEHKTNIKVITYPLFPMERGLEKKYRGIKVEELGKAIAKNTLKEGNGTEILHYNEFKELQ